MAFPGLPDRNAFIAGKQEPLVRFIHIIKPAASAHKLPMKSLRIFYDAGEGPIACNWDSNIYLNLRYFEEWREHNPLYRSSSDLADTAAYTRR